MCVKNTHIHASKRYIYMRLKCLVKNIDWIRAHTSPEPILKQMANRTILPVYFLYVKFPRMITLRCKTFKNIY